MMRQVQPVPVRTVAAAFLTAALLSMTAGTAQAETADDTALRNAAWDGKIDEVERLLEKGADPDVPDHNGWTALHAAAEHADARMLEMLLESGGNPNLQDANGRTPLILAALFPYDELRSQLAIRILLRFGAKPDLSDNSGRTPLFAVAINHQQPTSARDLLAAGADPNKRVGGGITPLHAAVHSESKLSVGMVQALVDGGARGDIVSARGETPLQLFVRVGSNDGRIVDALVDVGSDVNARNPDGESPVHTAIRNGGSSENNRVVEALLEAGADPCIKDASGYIPYNTAREGGEVHTMLANAGGSDIGCQGSEAPAADYIVDPADWPGETTARSNIRSGPGTDHDVVRTLDVSTPVHVTGTVRNTDWLEVEVGGSSAFVHASLVEKIETSTSMEPRADVDADSVEEPERVKREYVTGHRMTCVTERGGIRLTEIIDSIMATERGVEEDDVFDNLDWLESGVCAGFLVRSFLGQCDSLKEACEWPCENLHCREEGWTFEYEPLSRYDKGGPLGPALLEFAEAARTDPDGVFDDSIAQLETVWAETQVMLDRIARGEDPAQTAAMLEEDSADEFAVESASQEVSSGGDATVAAISTEPKCSDIRGVMPWDTVCWRYLTQPSDCQVLLLPYEFDPNNYTNTPEGEELTWSGACERGVATGQGVITWTLGGDTVLASHTGQFVDGVRQGHWEEEFDLHADHYGRESKGPYVDGLRHGDWVDHSWGTGFEQYDIEEGPYVKGKRSGSWLLRHWNQNYRQNYGDQESCNDAEYSDGDQVWASPPYWC